ncbi:AraC family transcriptional regulator, partial [Pyxidicoccus sp. 3LFB2]
MLLARPPDLAPRAPWPEMPLVVWPAALAMWGPGDQSTKHAHHAMHLLLCREGTLSVRAQGMKAAEQAAGVLVGPDVSHSLDARGTEVLLLFIEPESDDGLRLGASLEGPVRLFDGAAVTPCSAPCPAPAPSPMTPWARGCSPPWRLSPARPSRP